MLRELTKGFFKRNPIFVLMVGLCPTLATTTAMKDALAMGMAVVAVVTCSNAIISLVRSVIPKGVRIPCYIVIIAAFVTIVEMLMKYFLPLEVNEKLSIFIPLIVVNCIILYRAEDFAQKNGVLASVFDGIGMGGGFTLAVLTVSTIREVLGNGTFLGLRFSTSYTPMAVMTLAPGAFIVLGLLLAFFRWRALRKTRMAPAQASVPEMPEAQEATA
ncbi:MAG TPA: electron transport complex subunit E [Planctomycetota bacterium]|nr:electron transport complex subunit E [Planctomycetota bacterium]